jgi:hypothetical protein
MEVRLAQRRFAPRSASVWALAFEGIFRQAIVYKGRSRDTAWYSIVDREWPLLDAELPALARPRQFRRGWPTAAPLQPRRGCAASRA